MMRMSGPAFTWVLVAATAAWTGALLMATYDASLAHPGSISYLFSVAVYLAGSVVCHQRPERSFHWWGAQVPVCARCAGIYAGAAVAALSAALARALGPAAERRARTLDDVSGRMRWLLVAALAPTALTLAYEWTTGHMPAHWIRAASGVPMGAAVALVVAVVGGMSGGGRREGAGRVPLRQET
jgi:hypothetical protein